MTKEGFKLESDRFFLSQKKTDSQKLVGVVKNNIGNGPIILKYCQNIDLKDIQSIIYSGNRLNISLKQVARRPRLMHKGGAG